DLTIASTLVQNCLASLNTSARSQSEQIHSHRSEHWPWLPACESTQALRLAERDICQMKGTSVRNLVSRPQISHQKGINQFLLLLLIGGQSCFSDSDH